MKQYKAMVIGCGSIGALKPDSRDYPNSPNILTHAHAYTDHARTDLVALVDEDYSKADKAGRKWNCDFDDSIPSTIQLHKPDIISVCTPTITHHEVLETIVNYELPSLVIAEKPFCNSPEEAEEIIKLYERYDIPIVVNYTRRFSKYIQSLKTIIDCGEAGEIYHARLLYGRGLRQDGCHGIDLLRYLFGELLHWEKTAEAIADVGLIDLSYNLSMQFERCENVEMIAIDSQAYSIFELDILAEKKRFTLTDHGRNMKITSPEHEPVYGTGYKSMPGDTDKTYGTDLTMCLLSLVDDCVNYLDMKEHDRTPLPDLRCTAEDALQVHDIIKSIWYGRGK